MKRPTSSITKLSRRVVGTTLALGLVTAPLPVLAAPPEGEAEAPADAPADATIGGNVAVLVFTGDAYTADLYRTKVRDTLEEQGYVANKIKRSIDEAAKKNKCKSINAACLEKIAAYLNKNSKVAYDYYLWADIPADGRASFSIYNIATKELVVELDVAVSSQDYVLPEVLAPAIARRLVESQAPPKPVTPEEEAIIATLDEPEKTPEELADEQAKIDEAKRAALETFQAGADAGPQAVDLAADFEEYCRTGPREDREIQNPDGTVTKERDLRPVCKRGKVFGYWQPRAWVALTLTLGSAAAMGAMYGLAAAARSDWKTAVTNLEQSGLSATNPNNTCDGDTCYADLAGEVSNAASQIKRRAIIGDVLLGSTVLLTGVLAIIIYQDRTAAKNFIAREKELKALANIRVAPIIGQTNGAALGFEF